MKPRFKESDESQKKSGARVDTGLLERYNCGPVQFSGEANALYERHLTFDQVIPVKSATPRDKFEAIAHSIRDLLSQRWLKTEETYRKRDVKRIYYLSLEFLIGRSLANNISNLMIDPVWNQFCREHDIE
ncbi:MAG TPA: glycogen phosphorylase, partial [Verrucomicrobiae bacterium]|nr:glycogen phosphorylase [Verrucomicrobiae bacterium]